MIWEPFLLALVLGVIVSAGLYFAYLWPAVEPAEPVPDGVDEPAAAAPPAEIEPAPASADPASPAP